MFYPVGAVVVFDDEVIGVGFKTKDQDPRLDHSEICALRQAFKRGHKWADKMTIFTTLEPCAQCFFTALNCRVGKIVYAMEDPYGGMTSCPHIALPVRHQNDVPIVTSGPLREESRELLRQFFATTKHEFWQKRENPLVKACFL